MARHRAAEQKARQRSVLEEQLREARKKARRNGKKIEKVGEKTLWRSIDVFPERSKTSNLPEYFGAISFRLMLSSLTLSFK